MRSTTDSLATYPDRKRVLYLTHRVPYPPDKGDRIRNDNVLKQLCAEFAVSLACLADEPVPAETWTNLQSRCEQLAIHPIQRGKRLLRTGRAFLRGQSLTQGAFDEPQLRSTIQSWQQAKPFDAVIVSASSLAPYLNDRLFQHTAKFVDLVDVDSQKWLDFAAVAPVHKRWLYLREARRLRQLEQNLAKWSEAVFIVSRAEADIFDGFTEKGMATVATNGVDLEYFRPQPDAVTQRACAFVGALDYLPNIDAAIWFSRKIWPAIHQVEPKAEFWIIGRKPTAEVLKLSEIPGVKVIGQVPDVRPYVAQAELAVCPIRIARGLQNKVLEAMAMAKPTLAAPAAIAALQVQIGDEVLSPKTEANWVQTVLELFQDPARQQRLGEAARQFVEGHHHWDRCLAPMIQSISNCLSAEKTMDCRKVPVDVSDSAQQIRG